MMMTIDYRQCNDNDDEVADDNGDVDDDGGGVDGDRDDDDDGDRYLCYLCS